MNGRLAIVVSHPTQYYSPWFTYLAQREKRNLRVFYLWDFGVTEKTDPRFGQSFSWDVDLLSGYDYEFVPNHSTRPGTSHFGGLHNPGLVRRLKAFAPAAILLFGYRYRTHVHLLRTARRRGWPLLFRGDSHLLGHPPPSWLKRLLLRWVFRRFDALLYVGQANRDYLRTFGVADDRLFFAPHAVDQSRFAHPVDPAAVQAQRRALGADAQTRIVLFSGKFHPDKAPGDLLEALASPLPRVMLVLAGSGELEAPLRSAVEQRGLHHVRFLPFANQSEMPLRYALADIFVLPSTGRYETWGLAVNEAMHGGVPCIVSDRVGCAPDLITEGETGWTFPAGNVAALRQKLQTALAVLDQPAGRQNLCDALTARINHYTYAQTTRGLEAAWDTVRQNQP